MQQMQEQHGRQIRNLQGIHNKEIEAKDKENITAKHPA